MARDCPNTIEIKILRDIAMRILVAVEEEGQGGDGRDGLEAAVLMSETEILSC